MVPLLEFRGLAADSTAIDAEMGAETKKFGEQEG